MQKRGIVAALVVLLALLAWTLRSDPPQEPAPAGDSASGPLLPGVEDRDVLELVIGPDGKGVHLRRVGPLWTLAPDDRPAEVAIAELAVRALSRTDSLRTLDGVTPSAAHGLGPDAPSVRVVTADHKYRVQLGGSAPVGTGRYVAVDDTLHLADPTALGVFERDPLDFRDRRVFPIDRDEVVRIRLRRGEVEHLLTRDEREAPWRLAPDGARADASAVDALLRELAGLSATTWRGDRAAPTEADAPLAIEVSSTDRSATLLLAAPDDDGDRISWTDGTLLPPALRGDTAVVSAAWAGDLPADWLDPHALPAAAGDVLGFEWTAGGETWTIEAHESGWRRGEVELDPAGVAAFLASAEALEAGPIVSDDLAEGAVEAARLLLQTPRGEVRVDLLRGPNIDLIRVRGEPGVREVGADAFELLGRLRPFEAAP